MQAGFGFEHMPPCCCSASRQRVRIVPEKEIAVSKEKMLSYQQTNEAVSSGSSGVRSVLARLKLSALWPVIVSRVVK